MERLPYIDAHGVEVAAGIDSTWKALVRVSLGAFGSAAAAGTAGP